MNCPNCESNLLTYARVIDSFLYGAGPNPVVLEAEVEMFTCTKCGQQWTADQAEEARAEAVEQHQLSVFPTLVVALIEQHHAMDALFAMLIAKTLNHEKPFYPSESGQPWEAMKLGMAAIGAAGGSVSTAKAEGESPQAQGFDLEREADFQADGEAPYDGPEDEVREVNEDKVRERQPEERQP